MPANSTPPPEHAPPGAWAPARDLALRVKGPLERFLHIEAASGIALLSAALIGLLWANSRWSASYEHLWETPIRLSIGSLQLGASLHFVINDAFMVVFFFVVGLEIRREMHGGELSELKRAALPLVAALGGMLAPACIYFALNPAPETRAGWGVPMATDIAFAVGIMALLGRRIPSSLRVLLLAVAIIDDIGAIIVIALFYSSGVKLVGLVIVAGGIALVLVQQALGVRPPLAYVPAGIVIWAGLLKAGVHPTIAGVILGLLTPSRAWLGGEGFISTADDAVRTVRSEVEQGHDGRHLLEPLARIEYARREAVAPLVRLEAALHPWVAFLVMPVFALANSGVSLAGVSLEGAGARVAAGVFFGLVVGKPLGVLLVTFAAYKCGLCAFPRRVTWSGLTVLGLVAGIGFTMAIFIAALAFPGSPHLGAAKLAVLAASATAAVAALLVGRFALRAPEHGEPPDVTVDEAEASTAH
jgi:NhaA family Na+:H+ antiporter